MGNARSRLAIGSAQFGMKYGVANSAGQVTADECGAILQTARSAGIDTIDTAMSYGNSEARLGEIGVEGWRVVTKLPALPVGTTDVKAWVRTSVSGSLLRLRVKRLDGLLLHNPADLLSKRGDDLYAALQELKGEGLVRLMGLSVYDPEQLRSVWPRYEADVVQAPFNVIDRRLATSGCLGELKAAGVEVHVRSVFLQGLLLMPRGRRPNYFTPWRPLLDRWDDTVREAGVSAVSSALAFVNGFPEIDRVIIGIESVKQLQEIISAAEGQPFANLPDVSSGDPKLVNPSMWVS